MTGHKFPLAPQANDQALFNRIAGDYFKKDRLPSSSVARKFRLQQTVRFAGLQPHHKILEVGCGGGYSALYLKGNYARYLGIDYSDKIIEYAKRHHDLPNASFRHLNAKDLESAYNGFDMVLMIGVLHHLDDMETVLKKLRSHLKIGGIVVVNEPQPGNPFITFLRRIRKKVDSSYSRDQRELSTKELFEVFQKSGYANMRIQPQGFFSTPFAEVPLPPQWMSTPLSLLACKIDCFLEMMLPRSLFRLSWNLIFIGQSPGPGR